MQFKAIEHRITPPAAWLTTPHPCPQCLAMEGEVITETPAFRFFTDKVDNAVTVTQRLCGHCGIIRMDPVYTDKGYQWLFQEAGGTFGSSQASDQAAWLVARVSSGAHTLLDIGAWDGAFMQQLPADWTTHGLEYDATAANRGREQGLHIFDGNVTDIIPGLGTYDLITCFHTLEHIPFPQHFLAQLPRISTPETLLIIEVPILERGETNDINGFFVPPHVTHWSKATLRNFLSHHGWEVLQDFDCETYNGYRVSCRYATPGLGRGRRPSPFPAWAPVLASTDAAARAVLARMPRPGLSVTGQYVLWGAGIHAEWLYQRTPWFHRPGQTLAIIDSDSAKQGKTWRGLAIYPPMALRQLPAGIPLIISSYGSQYAIYENAMALGMRPEDICMLYDTITAY